MRSPASVFRAWYGCRSRAVILNAGEPGKPISSRWFVVSSRPSTYFPFYKHWLHRSWILSFSLISKIRFNFKRFKGDRSQPYTLIQIFLSLFVLILVNSWIRLQSWSSSTRSASLLFGVHLLRSSLRKSLILVVIICIVWYAPLFAMMSGDAKSNTNLLQSLSVIMFYVRRLSCG